MFIVKKGKAPVAGAFPGVEGSVLLTISIHGGRIAPHQMQAPLASDKNSLPHCAGNDKHHHDHVPPARYAAFSRSLLGLVAGGDADVTNP